MVIKRSPLVDDTSFQTVFADAVELESLLFAHNDNLPVLSPYKTDDDPFPLLHLKDDARYVLHVRHDDLIVAAASLYPEACGQAHEYPHEPVIRMAQAGVRPEFQKTGHARKLMATVFSHVARLEQVMVMTYFKEDGRARLAPMLPRLHTEVPDLRIVYPGLRDPVTGENPYQIECCSRGYARLCPA